MHRSPQRNLYGMKTAIPILLALLFSPGLWAQEGSFRLTVLSYQWTTSHTTLTLLVAWLRQHLLQRKFKRERLYLRRRKHFCQWDQFRHVLDYLHAAQQPEHRHSKASGLHSCGLRN